MLRIALMGLILAVAASAYARGPRFGLGDEPTLVPVSGGARSHRSGHR